MQLVIDTDSENVSNDIGGSWDYQGSKFVIFGRMDGWMLLCKLHQCQFCPGSFRARVCANFSNSPFPSVVSSSITAASGGEEIRGRKGRNNQNIALSSSFLASSRQFQLCQRGDQVQPLFLRKHPVPLTMTMSIFKQKRLCLLSCRQKSVVPSHIKKFSQQFVGHSLFPVSRF